MKIIAKIKEIIDNIRWGFSDERCFDEMKEYGYMKNDFCEGLDDWCCYDCPYFIENQEEN